MSSPDDFLRQNISAAPRPIRPATIAGLFGRFDSASTFGTASLALRLAMRLPNCQTVQPRIALRRLTMPTRRLYPPFREKETPPLRHGRRFWERVPGGRGRPDLRAGTRARPLLMMPHAQQSCVTPLA